MYGRKGHMTTLLLQSRFACTQHTVVCGMRLHFNPKYDVHVHLSLLSQHLRQLVLKSCREGGYFKTVWIEHWHVLWTPQPGRLRTQPMHCNQYTYINFVLFKCRNVAGVDNQVGYMYTHSQCIVTSTYTCTFVRKITPVYQCIRGLTQSRILTSHRAFLHFF